MVIDTLTNEQQLVLKTASMLGKVFRSDEVVGAYPKGNNINTEETVRNAIDTIVIQGYLKKMEPIHELTSPLVKQQKYTFTLEFMIDVLQSRMLFAQMENLKRSITEHRTKRDELMMRNFMDSSSSTTNTMRCSVLKCGFLWLKCNSTSGGSATESQSNNSNNSNNSNKSGDGDGDGDESSGTESKSIASNNSYNNTSNNSNSTTAKSKNKHFRRASSVLVDKLLKPTQRRASALLTSLKEVTESETRALLTTLKEVTGTSWKKRWIVIESHHILVYKSDAEKKLKWKIPLANSRLDLLNQNEQIYGNNNILTFTFMQSFKQRTPSGNGMFYFSPTPRATDITVDDTDNSNAMKEWNDTLKYALELASNRKVLNGRVAM